MIDQILFYLSGSVPNISTFNGEIKFSHVVLIRTSKKSVIDNFFFRGIDFQNEEIHLNSHVVDI